MARPLFRVSVCLSFLAMVVATELPALGQLSELDQIQVAPPMRQVQPPSSSATAKELEDQADQLRSQKDYLDAIDYFQAAIAKDPDNATLYNKMGIAELMLQRYGQAGKHFQPGYNRLVHVFIGKKGPVTFKPAPGLVVIRGMGY